MLQYEDYTVGWICALPVEAEAALYMLDTRHHGVFPSMHGDDNQYTPGEIAGHKVVIACLPKRSVGTVNAAYLVSQMRQSFPSLKFGLMVGIGAGVPGQDLKPDIRLGDVVVATPSDKSISPAGVMGYELGAETIEGFILRDWQAPTDKRLRNALESIERDTQVEDSSDFLQHLTIFATRNHGQKFLHPGVEKDQLYKGDQTHDLVLRQSRPSQDPVVHYGLIASGNKLVKNAKLRDALRDKYGIICFEMEAAGLMNTMPVAVIRGVCDYADSRKNDVWHHYAAATAAAYAKGLLTIIGPEHPARNG
jgi:nucleoside phosphorylase